MGLVGVAVVIAIVTWVVVWFGKKYNHVRYHLNRIQGPNPLPLIGNLHQFKLNSDQFFEQAQGVSYMFNEHAERICRIWLGPLPFVLLYGAEECEAVLSSSKMLTKLPQYSFLSPWIGDGLLISKPVKWRPRRKLLTPTFHYDILKDFIVVYNKHGATLVEKFGELADKGGFHDVFHTISLCTLDVICEAALGVCIDAQRKHTDYLEAVFRMKFIIQERLVKPQYYPKFLFDLIGHGKEQDRHLKILHGFTKKAIQTRRELMQAAGGVEVFLKQGDEAGGRKRSLLDLMIDMVDKGHLDEAGLQEEVDTFTFEGHDTTSAAMNFFLHLMGQNPQIQARVQEEVDSIIGEAERDLTFDDVSRLRFLEACLKETLRMYPSVPLIARQTVEDTKIGNHLLPAGTGVVVVASMVHRDPRFWPNPEVFNPDRFMDSELKHPYAYIPFSAGSRNCIGQRFAMLEEKCIIARILHRYKVKSSVRTDQLRLAAELIIRPLHGNHIRFERRTFGDYSSISD